MSRCFAYTPSLKAVNKEALVEPIKIPRDLEKESKVQRKKEKREKRAKKEKRDKKAGKQSREGHKENELSTSAGVYPVSGYPKEVESSDQEKSGITEEHELPILSENVSYLSDGTQSGAKRKRNIIRFKSLPKRSDPLSNEAFCTESTSGEFETCPKMNEIVHVPRADTNFEKATTTTLDQKLSCDNAEDVLHRSLIVNWVQPLLQSVLDDCGDEDWLAVPKLENSHCSKRLKASNEVFTDCTSRTCWPQAHWLPEPGLSALPFTVPF